MDLWENASFDGSLKFGSVVVGDWLSPFLRESFKRELASSVRETLMRFLILLLQPVIAIFIECSVGRFLHNAPVVGFALRQWMHSRLRVGIDLPNRSRLVAVAALNCDISGSR